MTALLTPPGQVDDRRPATRFPGPTTPASTAAPARIVAWVGGSSPLRSRVADHVEAAGCVLTDNAAASSPLVEIGPPDALEERHGSAPAHAALIAVADDGALTEEHWRSCLELGVKALVRLPSESERLLDLLGELLRPRSAALVIGVTGGCGGAGASSIAARLAGATARTGAHTVLVDADPLGGGLDVLVEAPPSTGGAWEDVGRLDAQDGEQLRAGLPTVDSVKLLAARQDASPSPEQCAAALSALAPLGGVVIVDLGAGHVGAALSHIDHLLLVVPSTDHAVRAASRRLAAWPGARRRCGLLVRRGGSLTGRDVADDLGLPLLDQFRDSRAGAIPLLDVRRRGADRMCSRLITRLGNAS